MNITKNTSFDSSSSDNATVNNDSVFYVFASVSQVTF